MDSSSEEIARLNARIERLERSQRVAQRLGAATLIVGACVLLSGAARGTPQRIDATEFRVVDPDGQIRATLGPSTQGRGGMHGDAYSVPTTAFRVFDSLGSVRASVQADWGRTRGGHGGELLLTGVPMSPPLPAPEPGVVTGSVGLEHVVLHAGATGVVIQGPDGEHVALSGDREPRLTIRAGRRQGSTVFGGGGAGIETSGGTIRFFDHKGERIATVP